MINSKKEYLLKTSFWDEFLSSGCLLQNTKNQLLLGCGSFKILEKHDPCKISFYFPDFFLEEKKPWFLFEKTFLVEKQVFLECLPKKLKFSHALTWNLNGKQNYQKAFNDGKKAFETNLLKKIVLYVYEMCSSFSSNKLPFLIEKALHKQNSFSYGLWDKTSGMIGATPELLFYYSSLKKSVETVACAGTKSVKINESDFLTHAKDRIEHDFVVKGIVDSFKDYATIKQNPLEIKKCGSIQHLFTKFSLTLQKELSFEKIVKLLHPTPALGTYPKEIGFELLKKYNKEMPRYRYGAPCGYYDPLSGDGLCYVAIRNTQWFKEKAYIFAGGGIVENSEFEDEWQEILLKLETIKTNLSL